MRRTILILSSAFLVGNATAAELSHTFNSPAFSGVGFSTHALTVKQLEDQAKASNKAAADAIRARAEAAAANTPQAQFVASLQSRIYAQMAKQITDSLFGTNGTPTCSSVDPYSQCGAVSIAGNDITWRLGDPTKPAEAGMIVVNIKGQTGGNVELKVPSGTFYF